MFRFLKAVGALGICLASLLGYAETSGAQQNPVTAIDIALAGPNNDSTCKELKALVLTP